MKLGIYDSGVGGMTVAKQIKNEIPNADIIYVADSKFFPYNGKTRETIFERSVQILDFFNQNNCNSVIIACNTASSIVLPNIVTKFPNIKIFSIIDMIVEMLPENLLTKKMAILGTIHTVNSNVYDEKIKSKHPHIELKKIAAPLLATLCEDFICKPMTDLAILHNYLEQVRSSHADSLLIACTHYPILINEIKRFFKNSIDVIYTPNLNTVSKNLQNKGSGQTKIYSTAKSESIEKASKILLNNLNVNIINI